MKATSKSRRKRIEKISFEEVMGAAGMSGFGALLQLPPETNAVAQPSQLHSRHQMPAHDGLLRLRDAMGECALRIDNLVEQVVRHSEMIRSLKELQTRRDASLRQASGMLSQLHARDETFLGAPLRVFWG